MPVHNHGTEDGPGLACNEIRQPDGSLVGSCILKQVDKLTTDLYAQLGLDLTPDVLHLKEKIDG